MSTPLWKRGHDPYNTAERVDVRVALRRKQIIRVELAQRILQPLGIISHPSAGSFRIAKPVPPPDWRGV